MFGNTVININFAEEQYEKDIDRNLWLVTLKTEATWKNNLIINVKLFN